MGVIRQQLQTLTFSNIFEAVRLDLREAAAVYYCRVSVSIVTL